MFAQSSEPFPADEAAAHTRRAQQYLAEKKPELAIPELRAVVQLNPTNVDAHANLGVLLYFQAKYAEAAPELRAAVQAQPGLAKIQALLGTSEKRTGDLVAAQQDLAAAFPLLEDKKIRVDTGLQLVEAEQALGMLDKAAAVIANLRELAPDNAQILAASYQIYAQAMDEALLGLAVAAPASAQLPFILGLQLLQQGQGEKAIVQFRKALAIDPNLPGLHYELAQTLLSSSVPLEHAQAESEYDAALKANPFDEKAWLGRADVQASRGAMEEAKAGYTRALALQPKDADAETGLAKVLLTENDKQQATGLLEHAVALDPTNITAHYRLSTLYRQEGRAEDAKKQLALYEHYKALHGELEAAFKKVRETPDAESSVKRP